MFGEKSGESQFKKKTVKKKAAYNRHFLFLIQADAVVDMIGFPDYIKNPQKLKEKYDGVSMMIHEQIHLENFKSRF